MKKDLQEKKLLKDVVTTPYEKVFSILHNVKKLLMTLTGPNNLYKAYVNELDWVIKSIATRSLYTFDLDTKLPKKSSKLQDVIECISDYSSIQRRTIQDVRKGFNLNVRNSERLKLKSFKADTSQLKQIEELKKEANPNFIFRPTRSHSQSQAKEVESDKSSSCASNENALFGNRYPERIQMEMFANFYDLQKILAVDFDIIDFKGVVGQENVLPVIGRFLFEKIGFVNNNIINSSKLDSFITAMSEGYLASSAYHNSLHGADVCQTVALYLNNSKIEEMLQTNVIDIISLLSASLGHDLGHPGLNNAYHINTMDELAITYNDCSVLENFHIANFFRIARREECNIYETFSPIEFKSLRKRVISCILATDMVFHGKVVGIVRSKLSQLPKEEDLMDNDRVEQLVQVDSPNTFNEQQEYLDFLIHIADIGHNTKRFEVSKQWVDLLNCEFWAQGDKEKEKELTISFLCDRTTANTPKSQIGFISAFIIPSFEVLHSLCPTLEVFLINAKANLKAWELQLEEQEKIQKTSSKTLKKSNNDKLKIGSPNENK